MKLISLNCNHCGAPLKVPEDARFVTCGFCEQSLSVEHNGSVYSTRLLQEISNRTDALADDVRQLKQHAELENLDRQWERDRERFMIRDQNGVSREPSYAGSVVAGLGATVFGLIWTGITSGMSGGFGMFSLFGLLFAGLGVGSSISGWNKAKRLHDARRQYRRRRSELVSAGQPKTDDPFRHLHE